MAPKDDLEYLKSLVAQINDKIRELEQKTRDAVSKPKTPAQQLRTILIGPPGAGKHGFIQHCIYPLTDRDRQGDASAPHPRRVLCVSSRDRGHVARTGRAEDGLGNTGKENHGCWRFSQ